ncbi:MAG: alpha-mannosyltransferase [Rhodospirillales bacterium]|nr:alpha-mannosyltransferase [Rhodospirillales bacterium]
MNDLANPITPQGPILERRVPLRLLIISDAWHPQVNGVVHTLTLVTDILRAQGDIIDIVGPDRFPSIPTPGYKEIRLALRPRKKLEAIAQAFMPCAIHIATEGPLGWAMRGICKRRGWPFTTAYHTKFPEYLHVRTRIPMRWSWAVMRRFHQAGDATLAATQSLRDELTSRGFTKVQPWTRGVDLARFNTSERDPFDGLPRPIFLYAGRVAIEKNIAAFLSLDLPGTKVVVGDGPQRAALSARFPEAHFTGWRDKDELVCSYAGADVFVFPSRTDTFGLVLLESLASGTPVAAFPVPGPLDVITDPRVGVLDEDLRAACLRALDCDRAACRTHAESYSWEACAEQFRGALSIIGTGR